ncbi:hypothetical protein M6B38_106300 [Iris pallida]|uniref:Uncharacterized protein n=1 Tax=Iris pallida TaxID=29817 RepID=A0AAX6ESP8_IRIPA|nr:hypothetical protein M6B38_106300 [Iris pallida]
MVSHGGSASDLARTSWLGRRGSTIQAAVFEWAPANFQIRSARQLDLQGKPAIEIDEAPVRRSTPLARLRAWRGAEMCLGVEVRLARSGWPEQWRRQSSAGKHWWKERECVQSDVDCADMCQ